MIRSQCGIHDTHQVSFIMETEFIPANVSSDSNVSNMDKSERNYPGTGGGETSKVDSPKSRNSAIPKNNEAEIEVIELDSD